jgi:hypothetical protein
MNKSMFCAVVFILSGSSAALAQSPKIFTGEIMDSSCSKMGSHAAMEKEHGMKDAKECTLGCVKAGAKYVLYENGTKTSYMLDDQTKTEPFAGQKVKVRGTLDAATNTIHVDRISQ